MLEFFILFVITGFILGVIVGNGNTKAGLSIIALISIVWAFIAGSWAIATLIELLLGFFLQRKLSNNYR